MREVSDRTNDNWRALFAVAEVAGPDWALRARTAVSLLADTIGHDAASAGEMLIADVHKVFAGKQVGEVDSEIEKISSADLTSRLVLMEGRPWGEWKAGKPLSSNALARQLKIFKIRPEHDASGRRFSP